MVLYRKPNYGYGKDPNNYKLAPSLKLLLKQIRKVK
jgi:hypothetical protein